MVNKRIYEARHEKAEEYRRFFGNDSGDPHGQISN